MVALDVKVGDRVLFGKWSGTEVKIDGDDLLIMKESDIMGIVDDAGSLKQGRLSQSPSAIPITSLGYGTWLPKTSSSRPMRAPRCCAASRSSPTRSRSRSAPRAATWCIEKSFGAPRITKDGVTVAKEIELSDKFENMGAQMVREVASKTNDIAGDGTTTATVLAAAIVREGAKSVAAGMNPMDLKRGIDLAVEAVVAGSRSRARRRSPPARRSRRSARSRPTATSRSARCWPRRCRRSATRA